MEAPSGSGFGSYSTSSSRLSHVYTSPDLPPLFHLFFLSHLPFLSRSIYCVCWVYHYFSGCRSLAAGNRLILGIPLPPVTLL